MQHHKLLTKYLTKVTNKPRFARYNLGKMRMAKSQAMILKYQRKYQKLYLQGQQRTNLAFLNRMKRK
jgi:hypothetical protein